MSSNPQAPDYPALLRRSLVAIEQLESKVAAAEAAQSEPVAIVGIGCRFPGGVETPEAFWKLLCSGVDAVTEVPRDRWDADAFFDPDPDATGKSYTRWGGFLSQVDGFDASFFGISPREAASLDPQQRLLLEVTWEALEHAGIAPSAIAGSKTAVHVGISSIDYVNEFMDAVGLAYGDAYTSSGSSHSIASGRLSYFFGLHGPNVAVDTACSSSLVAIHGAVQCLRQREANLALAGGVNLTLSPVGAILTSRARMMSFDGRCKTFDASADGYVRAEGCGMLVLKRLTDAQRDGDRVLAVIRGSALNQDGRSSGLTAPNGAAQEAVIREALKNARLSPSDISVVEAHGTGTSLGDPIEVNALGRVFGDRDPDKPLLVGSVKTNIGHAEAASGVAGVIKTVLALQHRAIPPHLHLHNPNPLIPWESLPIRVPANVTPWESSDGVPRRAGVSSFGFSGTNAHIVLEEPPASSPTPAQSDVRSQLLALSAQTPAALRDLAGRFQTYLQQPAADWTDVVYTAGHGRSHLPERLAVVARGAADAAEQISAYLGDPGRPGVIRGRATSGTTRDVAFLFTGQGAQFFGMGRGLYESQQVFRSAFDDCAAVLDPILKRSLVAMVMQDEASRDLLDDTAFTQPSLFAIEYALAQFWRSWGVEPTIVMGHSVGEYVAACIAGVFSLEDGLRLIAHRAQLMSGLPRDGSMVAVFTDERRAMEALRGFEHDVAIAAINGPENIVISGRMTAVDRITERLTQDGIEWQRLKVSHAFHSPLMEPVLDTFEQVAGTVKFTPPQLGVVSNLTGRLAGAEIATAGYWRRHIREAVRFSDGIATLHDENVHIALEIGPSPTLLRMGQRCPRADATTWVASLRKESGDTESMLQALGQLYVQGQPVNWQCVAGERAQRVDLPTYPFQRQRFWHDLKRRGSKRAPAGQSSGHPLLGDRLASPLHIYQAEISVADIPWLADHRIHALALFPAAGFLELALAATRHALKEDAVRLENVSLLDRLALPEEGAVIVQVVVSQGPDGHHIVEIYSAEPAAGVDQPPAGLNDWRRHASATAVRAEPTDGDAVTPPLNEPELQEQDVAAYYARLEDRGATYGPAFRGITRIATGGGSLLGRVELPATDAASAAEMHIHPALLDGCLQLAGVGLPWDDICVPVGLDRFQVYRRGVAAAECFVSVEPVRADATGFRADLILFDKDGTIGELRGFEFRRVTRAALERADAPARPDWLFDVEWQPAPAPPAKSTLLSGRWLLLSDAEGPAADLAAHLSARGASVFIASHGESFESCAGGWRLDTGNADHYDRLFKEAASNDQSRWQGVVSLLGVQRRADEESLEALCRAHRSRVAAWLAATASVVEASSAVWLVTRGSQSVGGSVPILAEAPAWGLGGVIAAENPAVRCVRVDLDPVERDDEAALLAAALAVDDGEARVAFRSGQRYVARLTPGTLRAPDAEPPRRLEIDDRGVLENLTLRSTSRVPPGPGAVEVRVFATGLNFRDVLNALGMYPGDAGPLGNECSGVITAIGEGVENFSVGDEVVTLADQSFATYVVSPAALTVRKPSQLTFVEAATIPVAFLTADYALRHLARIKRGDRVLIHAATGGVGMAALQIARRAGAEIFATAGTPAKRALARSLGADHVADSRSTSFAEEFASAGRESGLDIVLNSLAGEFIPASLGLLRSGGRFIEIGKTDIWDKSAVAGRFPHVEYHPLYLGEVTAAQPLMIRAMLERLMDDCSSGELTPLPSTIFPIEKAADAFRFMGQARHSGKVVITQRRAPEVRSDGTYLVTGGLGGLGLACARGLVDRGARHLVLVGRRAPSSAAELAIEALRAEGVSVTVARGDIAMAADVTALLDRIRTTMPPLRGVLHAAGVVDDGMLADQSIERFERVMAPKVSGTWHLHEQTRGFPLDFFVMFSSGAALLGSPGQSNYAAANSFMDALASVRQADGRHALSINWGSWADVGMAADVGEQHQRRWADQGLRMIRPSDGVRMLHDALRGYQAPQAAILLLNRKRLSPSLGPFFQRLLEGNGAARPREAPGADILKRLAAAPAESRASLISGFLVDLLIRVLAVDNATRLRTDQSLIEMGLDSLMAMELRNRVQNAVQVRLSVADMLSGATADDLAAKILETLAPGDGPAAPVAYVAALEEGSV